MPDERFVLTESRPHLLQINSGQAAELTALGQRLAGTGAWWGNQGDNTSTPASAIRVRRADNERWEIRVNDAVGLIAVTGLQLSVRPKIPVDHLLPLLAIGETVPRLDEERMHFAEGRDFWDLLARWYLTAVENVLRHDLVRDYRSIDAQLHVVRGRLDALQTVMNAMRGRGVVSCEYDEFDIDTPANRVLLAGLLAVLGSPVLLDDNRARARRLATRFDEVTALRPQDASLARPDRRMMHYQNALDLARLLLRGVTPSLQSGSRSGWAFLLRTPEAVEAGLRVLLQHHLTGHTVTKKGMSLHGSTKTLNPDLVFDGGSAVGDVKYKIQSGGTWENPDLYQVVAFAAGFRAKRAVLVSFAKSDVAVPKLQIGEIAVSNLAWRTTEGTSFSVAAQRLVAEVQSWLDGGS